MSEHDHDHDNTPNDNDIKFLKALKAELKTAAIAFKAKKDGTINQNVFTGLQPIGYKFFEPNG